MAQDVAPTVRGGPSHRASARSARVHAHARSRDHGPVGSVRAGRARCAAPHGSTWSSGPAIRSASSWFRSFTSRLVTLPLAYRYVMELAWSLWGSWRRVGAQFEGGQIMKRLIAAGLIP